MWLWVISTPYFSSQHSEHYGSEGHMVLVWVCVPVNGCFGSTDYKMANEMRNKLEQREQEDECLEITTFWSNSKIVKVNIVCLCLAYNLVDDKC